MLGIKETDRSDPETHLDRIPYINTSLQSEMKITAHTTVGQYKFCGGGMN